MTLEMLGTPSSKNELQEVCRRISSLLDLEIPINDHPQISSEAHEHAVQALSKYRDFLIEAIEGEKVSYLNEALMLRQFLRSWNLTLPFEPEDILSEGDIIEIYSEDMVQTYRNRWFYRFCSYDLLTMTAYPFDELFRRDEKYTNALIERAKDCLTTMQGLERTGVETHYMQESYASHSKIFRIEPKYCSPVFSTVTGNRMGFFTSQKATLIGSNNVVGLGVFPKIDDPSVNIID